MEAHDENHRFFINYISQQKHNVGFYQLVRILESHRANKTLRFEANVDLAFPGMDVSDVIHTDTEIILKQNLFNIIGQNSILPDHLTEHLLSRLERKDYVLMDFINIFTHNLLQKYYNSWCSRQFYINYETQKNYFEDYSLNLLSSLLGLDAHVANSTLAKNIYLYYAGILIQKVRSKQGLKIILNDFFAIPINISEFDGHWVSVPHEEHTRLDNNHTYNQLGRSSMLGQRTWYVQTCFRIIVGILEYKVFLTLLPQQKMLRLMKKIITFYSGIEYDVNFEIIVNHESIPRCQLRTNSNQELMPYQLGWNSWLKTKRPLKKNPTIQFKITP